MTSFQLREIKESDASWIYEACQDGEIQYWTSIPKPYLIEHAQSFAKGESNEYMIWVVENEESRPVGVISIHTVDEAGSADIGYWISPWGRGKGATKEAINLVEEYARSDSKINSLEASIADLNIASLKVAESAGFRKTSEASRTCPAGCSQTSASVYRKEVKKAN